MFFKYFLMMKEACYGNAGSHKATYVSCSKVSGILPQDVCLLKYFLTEQTIENSTEHCQRRQHITLLIWTFCLCIHPFYYQPVTSMELHICYYLFVTCYYAFN